MLLHIQLFIMKALSIAIILNEMLYLHSNFNGDRSRRCNVDAKQSCKHITEEKS